MSLLSDYQPIIGQASKIPAIVDDAFEQACIHLLTLAFQKMKSENIFSSHWKENRFSAHIIKFMREVRDDFDINLKIDPECHIFRESILNGFEDPDTSARIDIRVMGGWSKEDIYYCIEGKLLVQGDWEKKKASKLRSRYIKTGIDNYKNGIYAENTLMGCVVGYVVYGDPALVVSQINKMLSGRHRRSEVLKNRSSFNSCDHCYQSFHSRNNGKIFRISHILLDCTGKLDEILNQ